MTAMVDIENALLQRLSLLRVGTAGAFRTISGLTGVGKARLLDELRRQRKPAILVCHGGRKRASAGEPVQFTLYVSSEGLRDQDEARRGGEGVNGIYPLLDLVRSNLDGTTLLCGCGLTLVNEGGVADDDRMVVFQQTYEFEETP